MAGIDEVEKLPTNQPRMGAPQSGTYGEKQSLTNLQQALPQGEGSAPAGGGPSQISDQPVSPQRSNRTGAVPGVPAPLLKPTSRPGVPTDTPLQDPGMPGAVVTGQQRRMQILTLLADSPATSEATREWAKSLLEVLAS